jgi:hypothetical protein
VDGYSEKRAASKDLDYGEGDRKTEVDNQLGKVSGGGKQGADVRDTDSKNQSRRKKKKKKAAVSELDNVEVKGCGIPDANGTYRRYRGTCGFPYFFIKDVNVDGSKRFFQLYCRVPAGSTRSETRLMGGYWFIYGWKDGGYCDMYKCEIQDCNDLNPINKKWVVMDKGVAPPPMLEIEDGGEWPSNAYMRVEKFFYS